MSGMKSPTGCLFVPPSPPLIHSSLHREALYSYVGRAEVVVRGVKVLCRQIGTHLGIEISSPQGEAEKTPAGKRFGSNVIGR